MLNEPKDLLYAALMFAYLYIAATLLLLPGLTLEFSPTSVFLRRTADCYSSGNSVEILWRATLARQSEEQVLRVRVCACVRSCACACLYVCVFESITVGPLRRLNTT